MSQTEVLKIIEEAVIKQAQTLDLSGLELTSLPAEIGQLTNLTSLNLSYNKLKNLPAEIVQLTNLTSLYLSYNKLKNLPAEIVQLTNLTSLYLDRTQLTNLPAEIGQLTNLINLNLSYTQLKNLPAEIGQLINLTDLHLNYTQLKNLPAEIGQLINLTDLHLSGTQLTNLPVKIGQLTNLTDLNLSHTQLTNLPAEIAHLTNLTYLNLRETILLIPPEILQQVEEPARIINYYLQLELHQEMQKPVNEAKMLFVGQGSVGKTSLIKRLLENNFDAHENKTEGINIRFWPVKCQDENINLNVWDFGGQEIMHATHQFFLTKRSIYVLVLDARLGEEENRLEYWLKIIQSFGDNSPVIIVGNKVDQHPLDIDRRGLRSKYPNIKEFIETSCKDGSGINELRSLIAKEIDVLDHVHDLFPQRWFEIKNQLAQMEEDYISYDKYEQMCQSEGVTKEINKTTLIRFLHDLGIVLNFRDDPRLEETNVLNPEWITNGVYRILNDNLLMTKHKGILELNMLSHILDRTKYPRNKYLFIVDIMREFELCFPLGGSSDRFLIPDLLSKEEPATGEWDETLAFQYHYNILPNSIISRFIVRMHHYADKKTWWRTGIVIKHRENRALIKSDREDKKMFIWISGAPSTRRELLAMIRSQFDWIHGDIKGIIAEEKVPLPDRPDVVMDFQYLRDMETAGEETFFAPKLKTRLNVKELLDGVEPEVNRRRKQDNDEIPQPIKTLDQRIGDNLKKTDDNKEETGMENWWQNLSPEKRRAIGRGVSAIVLALLGVSVPQIIDNPEPEEPASNIDYTITVINPTGKGIDKVKTTYNYGSGNQEAIPTNSNGNTQITLPAQTKSFDIILEKGSCEKNISINLKDNPESKRITLDDCSKTSSTTSSELETIRVEVNDIGKIPIDQALVVITGTTLRKPTINGFVIFEKDELRSENIEIGQRVTIKVTKNNYLPDEQIVNISQADFIHKSVLNQVQ